MTTLDRLTGTIVTVNRYRCGFIRASDGVEYFFDLSGYPPSLDVTVVGDHVTFVPAGGRIARRVRAAEKLSLEC